MYQIRFVNQGVTSEVAGGLLSEVCANAGFPLNLVCGGRGTCGKCNVWVERNGVREEVLACREEITGDLAVYLTEEQLSRAAAIMHEYDLPHYLEIIAHARRIAPAATQIWANVGDSDLDTFRAIRAAGVTGVYHGTGTETSHRFPQRQGDSAQH